MSKRSVVSLILINVLLLALTTGAGANSIETPVVPNPPTPFEGAVPLDETELAEIEGNVHPIVAGAVAGAVGGAFRYATSPGEKDAWGLVKAVGSGAGWGAVGGVFATVGLLATTGKAAVSAASTAWSAWGSAHTGTFAGVRDHFE